ncbi:MAG: SagB/ThcOx family dehydrogenase [Actinomycetia bacterium]|nr:SagB/ThcOx family dehydrogenase [Actinomycetes bacterium]
MPTTPAGLTPTAPTPTQLLHTATSYCAEREWDEPFPFPDAVQDYVSNDFDHFPLFYKDYPDTLARIALPAELPVATAPLVDVLAGAADVAPVAADLAQLARLLHLSSGVVRTSTRGNQRWLYRAAGSAGARCPLETYVAVPDGGALPSGTFWYHPERHELVRIGPPPVGESPAIVVTGVPWRTGWRYRERGYRHIYWDAGTMLAQLLALADSAGVPARLFTRFPDAEVSELVGADGRAEFPLLVVALGSGDPALRAAGPAARGQLDADGREFPLITAAQHAGDRTALGEEARRGATVPAPPGPAHTVDEIIRRRGSMRLMDRDAALPEATLRDAMRLATRGVHVPHWVAVNAVDGIAPGLYRWPDLDTPERAGLLRAELYRAGIEQGLPRDASFVAISAIDLAEVSDHGYREAQLFSGVVAGRLHLLAYALGAAASGMTFRDSDIPGLLGTDLACLLWTCVGVGEYTSHRAGEPGAPAEIRTIASRMDDGAGA